MKFLPMTINSESHIPQGINRTKKYSLNFMQENARVHTINFSATTLAEAFGKQLINLASKSSGLNLC
jgi:hypothetical protein